MLHSFAHGVLCRSPEQPSDGKDSKQPSAPRSAAGAQSVADKADSKAVDRASQAAPTAGSAQNSDAKAENKVQAKADGKAPNAKKSQFVFTAAVNEHGTTSARASQEQQPRRFCVILCDDLEQSECLRRHADFWKQRNLKVELWTESPALQYALATRSVSHSAILCRQRLQSDAMVRVQQWKRVVTPEIISKDVFQTMLTQ